jgi:hypothetical protein
MVQRLGEYCEREFSGVHNADHVFEMIREGQSPSALSRPWRTAVARLLLFTARVRQRLS